MIDVKGRPRRSYRIELTPQVGYLRIRLDDDDDPEYWQEITIPERELLRLLAGVHGLTHGWKGGETIDTMGQDSR